MMDFTTDASNTTTRTFSQDAGGVRSEGGKSAWNTFTLPNGEVGLSGSVVDPNTKNNLQSTVASLNSTSKALEKMIAAHPPCRQQAS